MMETITEIGGLLILAVLVVAAGAAIGACIRTILGIDERERQTEAMERQAEALERMADLAEWQAQEHRRPTEWPPEWDDHDTQPRPGPWARH